MELLFSGLGIGTETSGSRQGVHGARVSACTEQGGELVQVEEIAFRIELAQLCARLKISSVCSIAAGSWLATARAHLFEMDALRGGNVVSSARVERALYPMVRKLS